MIGQRTTHNCSIEYVKQLSALYELQANFPKPPGVDVRVFLLRLTDEGADGMVLAALDVGDNFGIGG